MDLMALYKPSLCPLSLGSGSLPTVTSHIPVTSLVDLCSQKIVLDSSTTRDAIQVIPSELCYSLMRAALHLSCDRAVEVLVSQWPSPVLTLHKFAPALFDKMELRYSDVHLSNAMTTGMKYTTCLAHTFVECLKSRSPTKLKCLDLTGYPVAEVIVNYLASHVLLAYNEQKQNEIIAQYNRLTQDLPADQRQNYDVTSIMPEHEYMILLDMRLESTDAHMEACRALKISRNPNCKFRLCPRILDMNSLGVARLCVLLELLSPESLQGLGLQFNSIKDEGLQLLAPCIQKFTQLTALDLSYNCFNISNSSGVRDMLCNILASLSHLKRLDLSSNRLKRKYAQVLSSVKSPLEYLNVSFCGICDEDLVYLEHCPFRKTVTELSLEDNDLSGERLPYFIAMLKAFSGQLQVLHANGCNLTRYDLNQLTAYLPQLQKLLQLSILSQREQLEPACSLELLINNLSLISTFEVLKISYPEDTVTMAESDEDGGSRVLKHFVDHVVAHVTTVCERVGRKTFHVSCV